MPIALFDLDNTLIAGDSDHRWGEFICDRGLADPVAHRRRNDEFYRDYQEGRLDVDAYLRFALAPIAGLSTAEVAVLQADFLRTELATMRLVKADQLLDTHRQRGHILVIITATHTVVTQPIAEQLGVAHLIGSEVELVDGRYTGQPAGTPSFREGKVTRFAEWKRLQGVSDDETWFYSDSHNDLPLLERVDHPVAVNPDPRLAATAAARGWPVLDLRG